MFDTGVQEGSKMQAEFLKTGIKMIEPNMKFDLGRNKFSYRPCIAELYIRCFKNTSPFYIND